MLDGGARSRRGDRAVVQEGGVEAPGPPLDDPLWTFLRYSLYASNASLLLVRGGSFGEAPTALSSFNSFRHM